ncbi:hypothetical protein TRIATDRAFT_256512 [Trichoderma atroviride IMI 206040]|uniref:Uncharacterized protein n=1 Tax=Hypocrea atroviridis (strain ATCC 20476 / IMI 206040) TaxID=452589 RepID=G9NRH7_HYPAI|nr:uncharacterized protein TRIATDRAFT_256512 [Trichoderma atroviride IMI 206040]EHK46610.1 hypothetical protein TRIATDRAFT_256512 [Trichoderma atroviride IMI 206040]
MFRLPAGASHRVVAWQTGCRKLGENNWNGDGDAGVKRTDAWKSPVPASAQSFDTCSSS